MEAPSSAWLNELTCVYVCVCVCVGGGGCVLCCVYVCVSECMCVCSLVRLTEASLFATSGRLTSGSRPGKAVPSPFCQRSKDEGKLRPKFTKCEKINIFENAAGLRPAVAMAKSKWRQILLSLTAFSNVASKEGKPMSCASSVFIPVKRMGVCNFSAMG